MRANIAEGNRGKWGKKFSINKARMLHVTVIFRTADQTRRAEFSLSRTKTGEDVIQAALVNWSLSTETDYCLVNTVSGRVILPFQVLSNDVVRDGHTLEVEPVPVAGVG